MRIFKEITAAKGWTNKNSIPARLLNTNEDIWLIEIKPKSVKKTKNKNHGKR